jgi:HK97 family phage prohead protease
MRRELKRNDRIHKTASGKVLEAKDEDRSIVHVITRRVVDRDGDVIEPSGGRFENYRKNPIVLFGHRSWGLPIARNLELDVKDDEIVALTQFAGLEQASDEAERVYRLVRDGFLPATSIGFMPITWSEDKALPAQDGWWFKEWELFEYSVVSVPSNPEAIRRMIKAYGLPSGATEKDLEQALSKTRQPFWEVAESIGTGTEQKSQEAEAARSDTPIERARVHLASAVSELGRAAVMERKPELMGVAQKLAEFAKDFDPAEPAPAPAPEPEPVKSPSAAEVVEAALEEIRAGGSSH